MTAVVGGDAEFVAATVDDAAAVDVDGGLVPDRRPARAAVCTPRSWRASRRVRSS